MIPLSEMFPLETLSTETATLVTFHEDLMLAIDAVLHDPAFQEPTSAETSVLEMHFTRVALIQFSHLLHLIPRQALFTFPFPPIEDDNDAPDHP